MQLTKIPFFASIFVVLGLANALGAEGWFVDPTSGCKIVQAVTDIQTDSYLWQGACKDGFANGPGRLSLFWKNHPAGQIDGTWQSGWQTGPGTAIAPNGSRYEGEFVHSAANGQGKLTRPTGEQCIGSFKDGLVSGRSSCFFSDGGRYEGDFERDLPNGEGVYTWRDGTQYSGQWLQGQKVGHGTQTMPNGDRYDGEFRNDRFSGRGTLTWLTRGHFDGEFLDGKASGLGRLYYPSGKIYSGVWINGCSRDGPRIVPIGVDRATCE